MGQILRISLSRPAYFQIKNIRQSGIFAIFSKARIRHLLIFRDRQQRQVVLGIKLNHDTMTMTLTKTFLDWQRFFFGIIAIFWMPDGDSKDPRIQLLIFNPSANNSGDAKTLS